jgi:uncharacterized repeat protein (TIGR01451 family)
MRSLTRFRPLLVLVSLLLVLAQSIGAGAAPQPVKQRPGSISQIAAGDEVFRRVPRSRRPATPANLDKPYERAEAFYSRRTAGAPPISLDQAADLRVKAADAVRAMQGARPAVAPAAFGGSWTALGPDPIVQQERATGGLTAMAGRVSALAIRSTPPYTMYLGGAQGGVWISSTLTTQWAPKTDQAGSLGVGAIALAPSNENIVYVGTGEGALSGDSYEGVGVLKSTNGGNSFTKVSGNTFNHVSISRVVVHPTDPNTLYVATLRGRAGARRTTHPNPTQYGIWKSTDGGVNWTLSPQTATTDILKGATDLVIDPLNPNVLLASFWTQGISKTVDGGTTWTTAMSGLPANADYEAAQTRIALGISHPAGDANATVYAGFEYATTGGDYFPSTIWKSTNAGGNWTQTSTDVVEDYCGTQCTYDNEIGVDPTNANIVYALGLFNYGTGSGGIFRSTNGGASWVDIGWGLHPDYHSIAIRKDAPQNIVIGNDGGVWRSNNRGGRLNPSDPLSAVNWENLNGTINPVDGTGTGTGLQITQFTSMQQHPINSRVYGGSQDNGTMRKLNTPTSSRWFDFPSGDGGQVLVDPSNPNFVYGTYFQLNLYRFSEGMETFNGNDIITNGITTTERSEFYVPFAMDPEHTNRLYTGSYRVYRTDNANAPDSGDVVWKGISGDLTTGCTGPAPNGARNCTISALGVAAGAPALYVGTLDGLLHLTTNAYDDMPTFQRLDNLVGSILPARPVADIAVDKSDYRLAYVAYNSFSAATPGKPGHIFKTTDGGQTWTDVSGNLPDVPVNSLVLEPSNPNIIYAGTDVGPMVTTNGGTTWTLLGAGFPIVNIWQLNLNPFNRRLVAGTHGRGAWSIDDANPRPALQVRKSDAGTPVGPNSLLTYSITVKNTGNLTATGVTIDDPLPANTTFVSAGSGGTFGSGSVTWNGLQVPAAAPSEPIEIPGSNPARFTNGLVPGTVTVTFTVRLAGTVTTGQKITNDGITVASNQVPDISGSPYDVAVAPASALALTPASQLDGTRSGQTISYTLSLQNLGYQASAFNLSVSGNAWPTTFWNANFTQQITKTGTIAPGASETFGVRVSIPANQPNGAMDTATIKATSQVNAAVSSTATIQTLAVTHDVLLVDGDSFTQGPPVQVESYYQEALTASGYAYNYWDLQEESELPLNYMKAHKAIVWFTGASWPEPVTPYGDSLIAYLDAGGKLFMSGQDILDQNGGTTEFAHDYLHVDWDGSETQNDTGTLTVTAVTTNTVTNGMGSLPLRAEEVLGADYSNQITPIAPAVPAFRDENGVPDALTVAAGNYKVVFLAFAFEALGTPTNRTDLMGRSMKYFNLTPRYVLYAPIVVVSKVLHQ